MPWWSVVTVPLGLAKDLTTKNERLKEERERRLQELRSAHRLATDAVGRASAAERSARERAEAARNAAQRTERARARAGDERWGALRLHAARTDALRDIAGELAAAAEDCRQAQIDSENAARDATAAAETAAQEARRELERYQGLAVTQAEKDEELLNLTPITVIGRLFPSRRDQNDTVRSGEYQSFDKSRFMVLGRSNTHRIRFEGEKTRQSLRFRFPTEYRPFATLRSRRSANKFAWSMDSRWIANEDHEERLCRLFRLTAQPQGENGFTPPSGDSDHWMNVWREESTADLDDHLLSHAQVH